MKAAQPAPPLPMMPAARQIRSLAPARCEQHEPLIFERSNPGTVGVDLPDAPDAPNRLGTLARKGALGLPELSEPQVVRHYTRLSRMNYGIDTGLFPLGSCTMKHNPRLNERMARLPGFADLHPMQPVSTVQGALEVMQQVKQWLSVLTGMPAVALPPGAGAHGELCGMMAIKSAIEARGEDDQRRRVLAPASAHGTNPATAAMLGFTVDEIPENERGRVDLEAFEEKLGPDDCRDHADQPKHLRRVRNRHQSHRRRYPRRRWVFLL